ncbi:hypothetical protein RCL_jg2258.t2 [Rhizophagus clarus]|uniref:Uncharacterized protein n=1 Tax=Rhizophagus clarus TaxID=94130 RepID=A0A8H3KSB7_9GLOM|nr:hypothetical protein RCL_jg2258.t2 [Rhizophagus clarus]
MQWIMDKEASDTCEQKTKKFFPTILSHLKCFLNQSPDTLQLCFGILRPFDICWSRIVTVVTVTTEPGSHRTGTNHNETKINFH